MQFQVHRELPFITERCDFDTETYLGIAGDKAPKIVTCQFRFRGKTIVKNREEGLSFLKDRLQDTSCLITGYFIAYDMAVASRKDSEIKRLVYRAYDQSRIRCGSISGTLIYIAKGIPVPKNMSLATEYRRYTGNDISESKGKNNVLFSSKPAGKEFLRDLSLYQRVRNFRRGVLSWEDSALKYWTTAKDRLNLEVVEKNLLTKIEKKLGASYNTIPVRFRYADLDGLPYDQWPPEFLEYAGDDVEHSELVAEKQQQEVMSWSNPYNWGDHHIVDGPQQAANDFALFITTLKGFRTDKAAVEAIRKPAYELVDKLNAELLQFGFIEPEYKGRAPNKVFVRYKKNMTAIRNAVLAAYPPDYNVRGELTEKQKAKGMTQGLVKTSKEVLIESGDPNLEKLAEREDIANIIIRWIPTITAGIWRPAHTNFKCLVETGRTSSSNFNCQNQPRKLGIRNCFIAEEGRYYCSVDYAAVELRTLAQVCYWLLGRRMNDEGSYVGSIPNRLAQAFRDKKDPHRITGAMILGISIEEFLKREADEKNFAPGRAKPCKDARQLAKALNFGLPGGLGARKFVIFAKNNYGVLLATTDGRKCVVVTPTTKDAFGNIIEHGQNEDAVLDMAKAIDVGRELKKSWQRLYPDIEAYMNLVGAETADDRSFTQEFLLPPQKINGRWFKVPHRRRGQVRYNNGCNGWFQGLAACGAKRALFEVVRECDTGFDIFGNVSDLAGADPLAFIHDEIFVSILKEKAHAQAMRIKWLMEWVMQAYCPDVPIMAEEAMAVRWFKEMERVIDKDTGQLLPWEPKKKTTEQKAA